jgi:purine-binding chemotaxis protein CheW
MAQTNDDAERHRIEHVTATVGDHLFGLPIAHVQDVFVPERLTLVPLAPPEVAGILNLRGRIVMRSRLGLPARGPGQPAMAITIESRGESYGLLVDQVGEVVPLDSRACEANPANLDLCLARVSAGIHRLDEQLMIVLDVDRVLETKDGVVAA